ncbi:CapA family protein [Candidatus Parcubacteria bacterium]|nr:CapA family protein [Candidatus Parcubacteria bacterium]
MRQAVLWIVGASILLGGYAYWGNRGGETLFPQGVSTSGGATDILFVGDMNFDRYIRQVARVRGFEYLFSCIDPLLKEADLVVGNLEGPITDHPSVSEGTEAGTPDNYRFTFPASTARLLAEHNVGLVNIGNNHIGDFGQSGIASTKKYLTEAGVSYFGGRSGDTHVYRTAINGIQLSFVSYNQFGGDSAGKVAKLISGERAEERVVIVYTHWGEEYVEPTDRMRNTAKLFAESGADLIIGSHPHIVQSQEVIGDTRVYYSLGNFIFDQYWNESVRRGLAVLAHISEDGISFEEKPVILKPDGRTCPL